MTDNNLHRSLAPISDTAWEQIQEEASRTVKRNLAARRVVDVAGPFGYEFASVTTGHVAEIAAPSDGVRARIARCAAAGRGAGPVHPRPTGDRRCGARLTGFGLATGQGRGDRHCTDRGPRGLRGVRGSRYRRHRGHVRATRR